MKKFSERLRWLRNDHLSVSLAAFGEPIGFDKSYIHNLESGRRENPSPAFFEKVVAHYRVRRDWLENGKGQPFVGEPTDSVVREEPGTLWARPMPVHLTLRALTESLSAIMSDEGIPAERRIELSKPYYEALKNLASSNPSP